MLHMTGLRMDSHATGPLPLLLSVGQIPEGHCQKLPQPEGKLTPHLNVTSNMNA